MPIRPVQASFTGGVVSPSIYSRTDINKYSTSLRKLKNFIIHPTGGASNRPGTYQVALTKTQSKKCRVIPFVFSLDQAYTLEFGHQYIRFYTDGAQIQSGMSAYEIASPYTEDDLAEIRVESSADTIYIAHPDFQTRVLSRLGNTNWTLTLFAPQDGPFMLENTESISLNVAAVSGVGISMNATSAIFDPLHVGSFWKIRHYIQNQKVITAFGSSTAGNSISCFTTWRIITHGTWTGTLDIQKSIDGGTTWTILRTFSSADDFNANTFGTEDPELNTEPFLIRANMSAYTSGTANVTLTSDPFYQEGISEVTTYNNAISTTVRIVTPFGSTSASTAWSEGSWSNYRGWPRAVRFAPQDRLTFAGTYKESNAVWMSKTGQYDSFGRNVITLLDTDGISIPLPTRQLNAINGLIALKKKMLAFTGASEWAIGAIEGSALTPTTVNPEPQTYNGSSGIDPVVIDNQVIYMQSRGTVIRNMSFNFQDDGFTGNELNVLAKHFFQGHSIVEMAYQQEPDRTLWCLRDDGVLLTLTYMPEQEVVAWSEHETEGTVESICVIPASGYDELWLTVKRGNSRFIERMAQRTVSTDPQDQYFVDCGITYDDPLSITLITSANPCVVGIAAHGLSNGDLIDLSDIEGMLNGDTSAFNGLRFTVHQATTNGFSLLDEDGITVNSSAYTPYISGGYAREAFTEFSGLDLLNGFTVAILGNGQVFPQDVVEGGTITLNSACSRLHVGIPYESDLETLNVEVALKDGTLQGRKVKISNVLFRLINSRGGWIGPSEDRLHEAFVPRRTGLGNPPPLFSGDLREPLGAGYEQGGRIFFRQIDPLPVTISSIVPEIEVGGVGGRG